jgi:hypothetical protein
METVQVGGGTGCCADNGLNGAPAIIAMARKLLTTDAIEGPNELPIFAMFI